MTSSRNDGGSKRTVPTLTEVLHLQPDRPQTAQSAPSAPMSRVLFDGAIADAFAPSPETAALSASIVAAGISASQAAPLLLSDGSPDGSHRQDEAGERFTERVLGEVQRHIDLMLEYRLRETLTPALARMTDTFIRDTRNELASTLREIVSRAVEAELIKLRRE